MEVRKYRI